MTLADTPTYGTNDPRDDYYNDSVFYNSSGSSAGESATVTDYVGSTAVLTATFTTAPSTDSVYSVLPPWGEEYNYILGYGAAAVLLDDLSIPHGYHQESDRWLKLMLDSIKRSTAPKYIQVSDYDRIQ